MPNRDFFKGFALPLAVCLLAGNLCVQSQSPEFTKNEGGIVYDESGKFVGLFGTASGQSDNPPAHKIPETDNWMRSEVDGVMRYEIIHLPSDFAEWKEKRPLLFVFHGGGGHAWTMPDFTKFDELADKEHFIVVYPESVNKSWDDTRGLSKADDVGYVRSTIDQLAKNLPIDTSRVYATGISNGGFFSNRLACDLSDKIAAVASVAATMPTTLPENCHPTRPISVLYMNGTKDPLVPIKGGPIGADLGLSRGECISLADAVRFWTKWDKTSATPEIEQLPGRVDDGTHVQREAYPGGANRTEVIVYRIEGGGHAWPGGSQYLPKMMIGKASQQIDGSRAIWEFLRKEQLH
jgi:polyhydroxybutyrate depolymerase